MVVVGLSSERHRKRINTMEPMRSTVGLVGLFLLLLASVESFAPPTTSSSWRQPRQLTRSTFSVAPSGSTRLHFWRGKSDKEDDKSSTEGKEESESRVPFFGRWGRKNEDKGESPPPPTSEASNDSDSSTTATAALEPAVDKPAASPVPPPKDEPQKKKKVEEIEDLSPVDQAKALRAQAAKARLEAERMDAELTLQKINRLEKEIAHAKAKGTDDVDELQREMDALMKKMGEGDSKPSSSPAPPPPSSASSLKTLSSKDTFASSGISKAMAEFEQEKIDEIVEFVNLAPPFMKKALALQVELDYDTVDDIDVTELATRVDKMRRGDFSYSTLPKPTFTQEQIDAKKKELKNDWTSPNLIFPERIVEAAKGNDTEAALLALEYEYYVDVDLDLSDEQLEKLVNEDQWLQGLVDAVNKSAVDSSIETLYPKCSRKEGQTPTMAQVQQLCSDVLPKAGFSSTSKPEPVLGGYVIRGISKNENGDQLIEKIDEQLARTSLVDKMTVLFTNDFTIFADAEMDLDVNFDEASPILYVTGPDIVREPRRVLLSTVSALGIATTWYLSLYPFLLNPTIGQKVDEQLALADANMAPDLSWLTDLSLPLFITFVGIQILHEVAHKAVAAAYGMKTSFPTFVPSIITGITSSVTTFRTLPKNKEAMFDYAVAGPLVGILASLVAIAVGSQLTVATDPSAFPALPLEILRQSTLGGGVINTILGNGALSVPEGALGTKAVAGMNIPLHPVAIAGYISLVVNALSMLPVGTTDGGRMALALFGRGAKLLVGNLFFILILAIGLIGSDLFLFYFAFCIAFQAGNEVPARNEEDRVDFSRVIVAAVAYLLAVLALIPFQA